jgi:radical SAM protein with 4Fe4S-binding SPASM domain
MYLIHDLNQMDKNYRLNKSKVFCMAPWVTLNSNPNGDIIPCCLAKSQPAFGNLYEDKIENIWNNEQFKKLRLDMLNDVPNETCQSCYKSNDWGSNSTYRTYWNDRYGHRYDQLVPQTNVDGSLNTMNLYRWDFRFNNLCNLACVMCGPSLSSSWVELHKRLEPTAPKFKIYSSNENKQDFIKTIKSQASTVDSIYFAGGEPLMHSEHYEILTELDRLNKLDQVEFMYSTNLTNLQFKNYKVTGYWNKMKNCKVLVSLDEVDPARLYYIRYPSNIDLIIKNIQEIRNSLPTVKKHWSIVPAWSILNLHRMKDIIEYFYVNDLLPYSFKDSVSWEIDMHNIIVTHPTHFSISNAPAEWKEYLHQTLNEFEEWYINTLLPLKSDEARFFALRILEGNMNKFRNSLKEKAEPVNYELLKKLDEVRGTNFAQTFPELKFLL